MHICVLSSVAESGPDPYLQTCDPDLARFLPRHRFDYRFIHKPTAAAEIAELAAGGVDVFVNMCDGAPDQPIAGIEVAEALQRAGHAFTGADPGFYAITREQMKRACAEHDLPTPAWHFARDLAEVEEVLGWMRFPLIVKHHDSYNSVGLTSASRVENPAALRAEAGRMLECCGSVLIEEFIEGDEFSALVLENPDDLGRPIVLRPIRIGLPEGESVLHHELKNNSRHLLDWIPVEEAALGERIAELSRALFLALGGVSYGRCDLRMDADGRLLILELNANSGIFYVPDAPDYPSIADAIAMHDPIGQAGFLDHLIHAAVRRRESLLYYPGNV